jgi:D-serine deaminase-like pyridoxal phosphate-dependent protein
MGKYTKDTDIVEETHERIRSIYGSAMGRHRNDLVTPALLLDLDILRENLSLVGERMRSLPAQLRAHVKVHKSPHIARMQIESGAIGVGTATIWEAIVMARAGIQDVFVINQVVGAEKTRALALLAREAEAKVAVDDPANIDELSRAAVRAGSTFGVLVEIDTGMQRCGVTDPKEALHLARKAADAPGLSFLGLTGYEGHCSLTPERTERHRLAKRAMDFFVETADMLAADGIECEILSAAGTGTWEVTASNPRITEIQPGSYATMDGFHHQLDPRFGHATSVLSTVISRRPNRFVIDAGKKTVGGSEARLKKYDYPIFRTDEEHGNFNIDTSCSLKVGDRVELLCNYTPFAVGYFDAYHVIEDDQVVDIWPVMPRGPESRWLLDLLEAGD